MMRVWVLLCLTILTGCLRPSASPHYEVGRPYQAGGTWYYPGENFTLDETGMANVYGSGHASLTSDGEVFDQSAVMAGHATLQLPAVARLTNLENGRSILVRINDRGTGNPGRSIDVTRRTAVLLGMRDGGATRVHMRVLPEESHAASDELPGHPQLAIAAAPRSAVVATDLAPPPGMASEPNKVRSVTTPAEAVAAPISVARPAETVTQGVANPARLWVRLDAFEEYSYATAQLTRVSDLGATIDRMFDGRVRRFRVRIGPMDTVRQADDALTNALARGIPDARIVVE
jgi:rare lipoprotein A